MILTQTPLRVSLFGGGSDYPEHFMAHGGATLGMAVNKFVYVGVKNMPPGQIGADGAPLRYRVQYSHVDDCQDGAQIKHPAVRAAIRYLSINEPTEFHTFADLPGRSGLGGSSAFAVGLLHALIRHRTGGSPDPLDLAREAIAFEKHMIGEQVGFQDQCFSAVGGICHLRFGPQSKVHRVSVGEDTADALARSMVLVYTGTMRDAHVMASSQVAEIGSHTKALDYMTQQAFDAVQILHRGGDLEEFGHMLRWAWEMKKQLAPGITSPAIDELYDRGLKCGASGGKLLGAGGGGFFLFWVPPRHMKRFTSEIAAPVVSLAPVSHGSRVVIDSGRMQR